MPPMRSAPPSDPDRTLMIRVKACERLHKEVDHYRRELASNQSRMDDMVASGQDAYDIKMFQQVLDESRLMVPDSEQRLAAALEDLQQLVRENPGLEGAWMEAAQRLLEQQPLHEESNEDMVPPTRVDDLADGEAF